jgi:methylenetetrahydrofolate reductase (NADPH)
MKLTGPAAAAARQMLADPLYEVIPLSNLDEQVGHLPQAAKVTVTCSPSKGLDHTIDLAVGLAGRGLDAVPHISARQTRDHAHLVEVVERVQAAGITRAFVVGGDAQEPGEYPDGLSLLQDLAGLEGAPSTLGVPGYPEGHAYIPEDKLWEALAAKQRYAAYVATQLCFDPDAIVGWIRAARSRGITLPVRVGLPAPVGVVKLTRIATRIGIGDSMRYLSKQQGLIGGLAKGGGFNPDPILSGLAEAQAVDPELGIAGFHVFTFNEVDAVERWRTGLAG